MDDADNQGPGLLHRIDATVTAYERVAPTTSGIVQVRDRDVEVLTGMPFNAICVLAAGTTALTRN